jgi:hypothetical protein
MLVVSLGDHSCSLSSVTDISILPDALVDDLFQKK